MISAFSSSYLRSFSYLSHMFLKKNIVVLGLMFDMFWILLMAMVINATFNNTSAIVSSSVLFASPWQTLSQ